MRHLLAMPFGRRNDPKVTCVDAYRAGMRAVLEGAGEDSFILGCNAPMWPSMGAVHGMRVTGDISRNWKEFKKLAEENFNRNWQNGRLWMNEPDCVVHRNQNESTVGPDGTTLPSVDTISEEEFSFHAATILASGGMVLASDRMMDLEERHLAILGKLLPPNGQAAVFDDQSFRIGRIKKDDSVLLCLFYPGDDEVQLSVPMDGIHDVCDFWTGNEIASAVATALLISLTPHSARVLKCKRSKNGDMK